MILEVGFEVLVTMFTVFEDVLTLMRAWSCRGLWVGVRGWVIRWVICDCVC